MDLASLSKAAAKFGLGRVFPPTGRGLSDALITACARTDRVLGCGFGDTLSTNLAGRYDEVDLLASLLVVSTLSGRVEEFAAACVEANPQDFDEDVIGAEPITFLTVLARELHDEVRGRAKISASPLFAWFSVLQGDATLGELGGLRRTQQEVAGRLGEFQVLNVARQPARVRAGLPPGVPQFFRGREAVLEQLDGPNDAATVITAVRGIGGVGKTQLAAAFYRRHLGAGSQFEVAAWVDARASIDAQLVALAVKVGIAEDCDPAVTVARLLEWLASTERRWLLVVDNVMTPEHLGKLLRVGGNGRLVIISRYVDWRDHATVIPIDTFAPDVAAGLLRDVAERPNDPDAETLARRLGYLPLALVLAGSFCRERDQPFARYLGTLDERGVAHLDQATDIAYQRAVTAIWQESLEGARASCQLAPLLLGLLSHLNWQAVDHVWLTAGLACLAPFNDPDNVDDALAALRAFSLVKLHDGHIEVIHGLIAEGAVTATADGISETSTAALTVDFLKAASSAVTEAMSKALLRHLLAAAKVLGNDHPDTLTVKRQIANVHAYLSDSFFRKGDFAGAVTEYMQVPDADPNMLAYMWDAAGWPLQHCPTLGRGVDQHVSDSPGSPDGKLTEADMKNI